MASKTDRRDIAVIKHMNRLLKESKIYNSHKKSINELLLCVYHTRLEHRGETININMTYWFEDLFHANTEPSYSAYKLHVLFVIYMYLKYNKGSALSNRTKEWVHEKLKMMLSKRVNTPNLFRCQYEEILKAVEDNYGISSDYYAGICFLNDKHLDFSKHAKETK